MDLALQLFATGLVTASSYVVLALGFGLIYRTTQVFQATFGGLYALSPYILLSFGILYPIPICSSIVISAVLCSAIGVLIDTGLFQQFARRNAGDSLLFLVGFAAYGAMESFLAILFGPQVRTLAADISNSASIGSIRLTYSQGAVLMVNLIFIAAWTVWARSPLFSCIWAMGEGRQRLATLGKPTRVLRLLAVSAGSAAAGLVGCLGSLDTGFDPRAGLAALLVAASSVLFGGLNSQLGWVCGASILGMLRAYSSWQFGDQWADLAIFCLLLIIALIRKPLITVQG